MKIHTHVIHKFGGTSLAHAQCMKEICSWLPFENPRESIPSQKCNYHSDTNSSDAIDQIDQIAVVVSAMAGVTDQLIECFELAKNQNLSFQKKIDGIINRHLDTVESLFKDSTLKMNLIEIIKNDRNSLLELLNSRLLPSADIISGFGELWSAQILTHLLQQEGYCTQFLDARKVLFVEDSETGPTVNWDKSQNALNKWLEKFTRIPSENRFTNLQTQKHIQSKTKTNIPPHFLIITGFIASYLDGTPTTLKRNGSDYSAAIFAVLLKAREITIWKDVDGILSADPKKVPDARLLNEMSYNEASELAYFGAKVIHPKTLAPAVLNKIPIRIRNTFKHENPGTLIHENSNSLWTVKGFSTIDHVTLINVEGSGMLGVPGVASRLFHSLRKENISVIMISQASSEHSICFIVSQTQAKNAQESIEKEFSKEIQKKAIQTITVENECCVLAAVGDNMAFRPGTAGKLFSALGAIGVNVRAIAQGSSERNTSLVIKQADATRALQAVHSAFYLSPHTVSVGLMGPGLIGSTLLQQITAQKEILEKQFGVVLRIRAIANSQKMLLSSQEINLDKWSEHFQKESQPLIFDEFIHHIRSDSIPHTALIDCTSSQSIADSYPSLLMKGIHIITPNKKANSGSAQLYQDIRASCKKARVHYLYESTVGAGLPLINTLRELIQTGDKILEIKGILSGTLSYLFNTYDGSIPFSQLVSEARQQGYTEPDPRDDLSGMDVARKLVILAREAQLSLDLSQVEVENLIPTDLREATLDAFWQKFSQYDSFFQNKWEAARKHNQVLRYIGRIHPLNGTEVRLQTVPLTDPLARISGTDNLIILRTQRYDQQPLIIQGPGAGPQVTAGGVFADLLRLSNYLGAPSQ